MLATSVYSYFLSKSSQVRNMLGFVEEGQKLERLMAGVFAHTVAV